MKKLFGIIVAALCAGTLISVKPADAKVSVSSIKMNVGDEASLSVKRASGKVKWKSSNKKIVSVNKKGIIKALKTGKAKVTAKVGKKCQYIKVTVKKKNVSADSGQKPAVTSSPYVAPTSSAVPAPGVTPTISPTATPEATESWTLKYYVCDIMDDVLYLSESRSYKYNAMINKKVINDGTIFYKGRTVSKEELQIGDYISVNVNGPVGYSAGTISHVEKIVINERHPEVIGKKYAYTVTEKNGPVYTVTDEYGEVFTENHEMVLGFDKCRFYCDGEEITYDDMNIGDTVYLYTDDGHTCNPLTQVSVAKVIVVHKK